MVAGHTDQGEQVSAVAWEGEQSDKLLRQGHPHPGMADRRRAAHTPPARHNKSTGNSGAIRSPRVVPLRELVIG